MDIQRIDWDKESAFEWYSRELGLTKRYKEIEVGRHEVDTNIGGYTKNSLR